VVNHSNQHRQGLESVRFADQQGRIRFQNWQNKCMKDGDIIDKHLKPHPMGVGVMARIPLSDSLSLSVVGGAPGLYGDGVDTFEIAITGPNGLLDLPNGDQVCGYVEREKILQFIEKTKKDVKNIEKKVDMLKP
jgi:hypothetical protein